MSTSRASRDLREWVMNTYGNSLRAPCSGCGILLERRFLTLDRYPIPGYMGGTYRRDNVRPMCAPCNNSNKYTPTRKWVINYAIQHGIKLRRRKCPKYSAEWYRRHRPSHQEPLTQTISEAAESGKIESNVYSERMGSGDRLRRPPSVTGPRLRRPDSAQ